MNNIQPDGDLRGTLRTLGNAISALIDPKPHHHDGTTRWLDSLYQQLTEAVPGEKCHRTGVNQSQPPLWVDASDQLHKIDTQIAQWQRDPGPYDGDLSHQRPPTPETVRRLHLLEKRPWRPQDCAHIATITNLLEQWSLKISELLSPATNWTLPNPCPACNTAVVYRKDSGGDLVRRPALQIGPYGCECGHCHYIWEPSYYVHLARVLGYEVPSGVLE